MFSFRLTERRWLLITVDLILAELATLFAFWIMAIRADWLFDGAYLQSNTGWFLFLPALWFITAFPSGLYDFQNSANWTQTVTALVRALVFFVVVYVFLYFFLATPGEMPRGVAAYEAVASFFLIALWRAGYIELFKLPLFRREVIIIGAGQAGQIMAQTIQQSARAYYHILGFVDDDPPRPAQGVRGPPAPDPLPVLGACRDLVPLVTRYHRPELVLAITHDLSPQLFQILLECKEQGVSITLMSILYEQLRKKVPIDYIGDNWNVALPLNSADVTNFYRLTKRVFDIVTACLGLVLFGPLFPLLALAIFLDSGRPILYFQERVGKGGQVFKMLKLRSMAREAEADGLAIRASEKDPRVTRVGNLLRKTRLDEMPQLINILRGEMSAVGPRPERPAHHAELDHQIPFHRLRLAVNPGMAGWAVINGDYVDDIDDAKTRLEYDLYYIKHQSIGFDLLILLRMMVQMFALRGR